MPIFAISELRHGELNDDGENELTVFLPGDEVMGVPDKVLLEWITAGSVLLVGKDKNLASAAQVAATPVEEPPIYSAADPRYLQQQRDARKAAQDAEDARLKAFKEGR